MCFINKSLTRAGSYNANSTNLFPYDPTDTYDNSILGKPAILTFCPKMMMKVQVAQAMHVHTDPHCSKSLLATLIMKDCHLILHLDHMMSYRIH